MMRWACALLVLLAVGSGCWSLQPGNQYPDVAQRDVPSGIDADVGARDARPDVVTDMAVAINAGDGGIDALPADTGADVALFDTGVDVASPDTGADVAASDTGVDVVPIDTGPTCTSGQTLCSGTCTNTMTDPGNCGACGRACPGTLYCVAGTCGCPTGEAVCSVGSTPLCENLLTDIGNCGVCGHACGSGQVCTNGVCCGSGLTGCGVACVNVAADAANCGTCGHACASGMYCMSGACIAPTPQRSCPTPGVVGCGFVAIPDGTFTMGGDMSAVDSGTGSWPPAQTSITVSGFTLDAYEVTVARFRVFWNAGHPAPPDPIPYPGGHSTAWGGPVTEPLLHAADSNTTWSETAGSLEAHPINDVSWYTAQAFCVWDGGRLPTEAEWEFAARSGSVENVYPWGSVAPQGSSTVACDRAQFDNCVGQDGNPTTRVGSFAAAPNNLYDLAGNVWEWTADWYAAYTDTICWNNASQSNPLCDNSATGVRVVRGGSWDYGAAIVRAASLGNYTPAGEGYNVGFRCARSP